MPFRSRSCFRSRFRSFVTRSVLVLRVFRRSFRDVAPFPADAVQTWTEII